MSAKTTPSSSPISQAAKRFQDRDYPLIVRIINGHLVVTSPDFQFPIPIVLPYNPPSVEKGGKALIAAFLQMADFLKHLDADKQPHPMPSSAEGLFPKLVNEIPLSEACRILGMKPDMVRALADEGRIPSTRTPKGHRRFSREKLHNYIRISITNTAKSILTRKEGDTAPVSHEKFRDI